MSRDLSLRDRFNYIFNTREGIRSERTGFVERMIKQSLDEDVTPDMWGEVDHTDPPGIILYTEEGRNPLLTAHEYESPDLRDEDKSA
ncbi:MULTISPECIES: hypothetical protein [Halobacterium]|uniref:Uncharacterized protein n=1 Tax=Halobacterium salinarum TaxID=2242 RepID=A0A841HF28_HALSI|nr:MULTISPECIES: hypothetical protein [Halobacterium]MBB6091039.1 hypothetical protein [Halobacterium salinarum]MCF2206373.1 hypothetical protein [Halobacterium salinarum]MCF2241083.1 hypothetical protein [Halobacterium salinarum]MDL0120274.1 hypothetical protein [Halobacterium salinarum]QRY24898.1 hypothetical protein JRZ79_00400 [Halobacterium sp. BOL4-2]